MGTCLIDGWHADGDGRDDGDGADDEEDEDGGEGCGEAPNNLANRASL